MQHYIKEAAKPGTKKDLVLKDKHFKLSHDMQINLINSLANQVVKGIILKQTTRPLDSIVGQLQMINGRLYRVVRRG